VAAISKMILRAVGYGSARRVHSADRMTDPSDTQHLHARTGTVMWVGCLNA
jgi:hypothetical protein